MLNIICCPPPPNMGVEFEDLGRVGVGGESVQRCQQRCHLVKHKTLNSGENRHPDINSGSFEVSAVVIVSKLHSETVSKYLAGNTGLSEADRASRTVQNIHFE